MKGAFHEGNKRPSVGEFSLRALGQVRLRVAYCGICGTDNRIYLENMNQ